MVVEPTFWGFLMQVRFQRPPLIFLSTLVVGIFAAFGAEQYLNPLFNTSFWGGPVQALVFISFALPTQFAGCYIWFRILIHEGHKTAKRRSTSR